LAVSSVAHALPDLSTSFREHYRLLWGICYRLTGSASDAEDLVQDAYARALEKPPTGELRPWLVTVAMNLGRDLLRKRKRRKYVGPWLPEPVALGADGLAPARDGAAASSLASQSSRYELRESASFAFLIALEALTPQQRAVLLLRDVFDYSVRETAAALSISEPNTKTTLHRARKRMLAYDTSGLRVSESSRATQALQLFLTHVTSQDVDGVERMLAADCVALSDGGGEFFAARVPILGRAKVAKFYMKIAAMRPSEGAFEIRMLNGVPALLASFDDVPQGQAPHVVLLLDVAPSGEITRLYSVLTTQKIRALYSPA
jgi:RNA polymerase sigma-70 factor (ECF subfamily)